MNVLPAQPEKPTMAATVQPLGGPKERLVVHTPVWVTVVRGFQLFFALVVMVLAGLLIHGLALDAIVYALVCGFLTYIVTIYALATEKAQGARAAYNVYAVITLDSLMVVLWLASMGAVAALRGTFIYDVTASCYNDGSAVNSNYCVVWKRMSGAAVQRRGAVANAGGLAYMSAIAGLSALVMLLFVATLAYVAHMTRLHNQKGQHAAAASTAPAGGAAEMQLQPTIQQQQTQPLMQSHQSLQQQQPQYQPQQYQGPATGFPPQYTGQTSPSPMSAGISGSYQVSPQQTIVQPHFTGPQQPQQQLPPSQQYELQSINPATHHEMYGSGPTLQGNQYHGAAYQ